MPENNNINNDWDTYQPDLTAEHSRHQQRLEPLISLYQDGESNEEETATVEQYLSACAECRAYNDTFRALNDNLSSYMEAIPALRFDRRRYSFLDEAPAAVGSIRGASDLRVVPGSGLPDDRLRPQQPRRAGFAYNLAGGMAAALLIGLVAVFLLLVMQQVNQNKNNNTNTAVAIAASQTQTVQSQTTVTQTTPTSAPTTPAVTESPVTATPEPTNPPEATAAANTPDTGNTQGGPTAAAVTGSATQKTQPNTTQRPLPTSTPVPVPTNTPVANRTTVAAQPTATPTREPATIAPATVPVETATPEATTAPAETVAPTVEVTIAPVTAVAPTATTVPPTPGETSASAPGWIAYVDQSDGQIHLVKADGKNDQVISDPTVSRNFTYEKLAWSNNGKMLVAVGLNNNTGSRSIYFLDIFNPLRVEELAVGFAPTFSPDSQSIAFLSGPATVKNGVLYGKPAVYSLRKRTVTTINTTADSFAPQWFADSSRLLLGQDRVYNPDTDTVGTFKLPFTNTCLAASLSPFGDKLANLELQPDGSYQTVIYALGSGTIDPKKPLAKVSADFQGKVGINCGTQRLNWTPDSRNVYYYVNSGDTAATCLVQANGGGSRCLPNVYDPSFNSDGSALVDISLTSSGDGQIYTTNSSVTARPPRPRLIAESTASPVWQPL